MRERKYTAEFIISIINEHLETGKGSKVLSAKYGINDARVAEWLKEYHTRGADSFFRDGKNKSYDISLKKRAVEDYLTGKGSIQEITIKYGIRCRKQLREWIKVYNSGRGSLYHTDTAYRHGLQTRLLQIFQAQSLLKKLSVIK